MIAGLAFAVFQSYGKYLHEKVTEIKKKNTGRMNTGLFRYGLDGLQVLLLHEGEEFARQTEKFVRYLSSWYHKFMKRHQTIDYQ